MENSAWNVSASESYKHLKSLEFRLEETYLDDINYPIVRAAAGQPCLQRPIPFCKSQFFYGS